jgi:glucose-6-phosphate-specific signal transduction histidine kinase
MELSKKNRELASEIEKEKRKAKQLARKVTDMENQVRISNISCRSG